MDISDINSIKNDELKRMKERLENRGVDTNYIDIEYIYNHEKSIFETIFEVLVEMDKKIEIGIRDNEAIRLSREIYISDGGFKKAGWFFNRKYTLCESYKIITREIEKRGFIPYIGKWYGFEGDARYWICVSINNKEEYNLI